LQRSIWKVRLFERKGLSDFASPDEAKSLGLTVTRCPLVKTCQLFGDVIMRIGLLEVSHWHFPLYAAALRQSNVNVVALSDSNPEVLSDVSAAFDARGYRDPLELIESEHLDLAFVFGRHNVMPTIAQALIDRRVPFALEKPGGLDADSIASLRASAEQNNINVAVAFVQLVGPVYAAIRKLIDEENATFTHSSWRFFAGPPARYKAMGSDWMLDPEQSGGGCLINLAPHFIDLAHRLHGVSESAIVRLSSRLHGAGVEDYAMVSLRCADGATAMIETGYCFPDHDAKREYSFSLVGPKHYVRSTASGISIYRAGQTHIEELDLELDADPMYATFVARVIADMQSGAPPTANLEDLEAVMRVMDVAYGRSAEIASV
jgi:predicted dehydrogenase